MAEVRTRSFLASLVPVILNAVLNEHQLVLDIVAFVALGDFPRSRLGEKQRGKILANWVSRKMRTIAQFSIRDPDSENLGGPLPDETMRRQGSQSSHRTGAGTPRGGTGANSLRQSESLVNMPLVEEPYDQDHFPAQSGQSFAEDASIYTRAEDNDGDTPTKEVPRQLQLNDTLDYSPIDPGMLDGDTILRPYDEPRNQAYDQPQHYGFNPVYQPSKSLALNTNNPPKATHPQYVDDSPIDPTSPHALTTNNGGLRVMNATSPISPVSPVAVESDWGADALRHMKIQ